MQIPNIDIDITNLNVLAVIASVFKIAFQLTNNDINSPIKNKITQIIPNDKYADVTIFFDF